ncbi:unnamed protein product, partial [Dovyalis caffra]
SAPRRGTRVHLIEQMQLQLFEPTLCSCRGTVSTGQTYVTKHGPLGVRKHLTAQLFNLLIKLQVSRAFGNQLSIELTPKKRIGK